MTRVTYDSIADAAYIYLTSPEESVASAKMYACDPTKVDGMINLDFDGSGRLIGIEVLGASSKLSQYVLDAAEDITLPE